MDNLPKITFTNSPRTEEERLKFTRKIIASGFYEKHGFVVLPGLEQVDERVVVIYPKEFVYERVSIETVEAQWKEVNDRFWNYLEEYFPGSSGFFASIEVRLTRFGTVSSGAKLGVEKGRKGIYYLRTDVDLSNLVAMIINNVLYLERKGLGITWSKREVLMDFVMTRPRMRKLFPEYRPVMSGLARVPASVRKRSEEYLRRLGIPKQKREFEIVGGKIWVNGSWVGGELTKLEKKVLKLLIERRGELVSYDELADEVWGVGEFKTFWALNKLIERLRPKLTKLGVEGERIKSVRGQGYILV